MNTKHIKNCIAMIKRSEFPNYRDFYEELPETPTKLTIDYKLYKPYLDIFKKELEKRNNIELNLNESIILRP